MAWHNLKEKPENLSDIKSADVISVEPRPCQKRRETEPTGNSEEKRR
jgi:hypothetical protein